MKADVFISHSSKDKHVADAVCAVLERRGLRCWIAPRDVTPGASWGAEIVGAIENSHLMVLVVSEAANSSPQIEREVERAIHLGRTVIPLRVQDIEPAGALNYFISASHWLDAFTPPIEGHLERLGDAVQALLEKSGARVAADRAPPSAPQSRPDARAPAAPAASASRGLAPIAITAAVVALAAGGLAWQFWPKAPAPAAPTVATAPLPTPPKPATPTAQPAPGAALPNALPPVVAPTTVPAAPAAQAPQPPPPAQAAPPGPVRKLVFEEIPFLRDMDRETLKRDYPGALGHKAIAISFARMAMSQGQASEGAAANDALERCKRESEAVGTNNPCYVYAIDDRTVWRGSPPPMPPRPWVSLDPNVIRPFDPADVPQVAGLQAPPVAPNFGTALRSKALAVSANGKWATRGSIANDVEAMRRTLEICGFISNQPCRLLALNDRFVSPVPHLMKATTPFNPAEEAAIAPGERAQVERRLAEAPASWSAVAAGAAGKTGVAVKAPSEQAAVDGALQACGAADRACAVIAVGGFKVAPR